MKIYGLLNTISQGFITLMRLLFPTFMSIYGYFRAYSLGVAVSALSQTAYIGSEVLGGSVLVFSIGYILSSLRRPIQFTSRAVIVAEYVESDERAMAMGIVASISMLAAAIGPYLGSYIYENLRFRYIQVFSIALIVTLLSAIPTFLLAIRDKTAGKYGNENFKGELNKIKSTIRYSALRKTFLILSLDAFTWSISGPFTSIYYAKVLNATPYELATVSLIISVISIIGFPLSGIVSDKIKRRILFLILSEIAGILYFTLILLAENMLLIYLASIFMGFVIIFWGPIASTYITELAETHGKELVSSAVGAWGFLTMLARMPGSLIGGVVFDINPKLPFTLSLVNLVTLILLLPTLPEKNT